MVELAGDLSDLGQAAYVSGFMRLAWRSRRRLRLLRRRGCSTRRCRRRRQSARILRLQSSRDVETLQFLIALFLAWKELLNSLQPLYRLGLHSILHQDFGLQHQILQRGRTQCRLFHLHGLFCFFYRCKSRGDHVEALVVDLPAQSLEPLLVTRLVGIHFRRAIKTFPRSLIIVLGAIEVKQFQQNLRVI